MFFLTQFQQYRLTKRGAIDPKVQVAAGEHIAAEPYLHKRYADGPAVAPTAYAGVRDNNGPNDTSNSQNIKAHCGTPIVHLPI